MKNILGKKGIIMKKFVIATMLMVSLAFAGTVIAKQSDKVYVCHAAGRAGTLKYVTLHVPATSTGYPKGHFTENGTQEAGHEQDYLGKCVTSEPSPTPTPEPTNEPTATPVPTGTPTPTPTNTPSAEPTATPTNSGPPNPSETPTPTDTPTITPRITLPPTDTE